MRTVGPMLLAAVMAALVAGCVADPSPSAQADDIPPARSREELREELGLQERIAALGPAYRAVTVDVRHGHALLMGAVIKPMQRRKAEQVARAQPGVTAVHNDLVLAEDAALSLFTPDPGMEALLRRAVGPGPSVHAVNGVAFVFGPAADARRTLTWKLAAAQVDGVKWVVSRGW